MGWYEDNGYSGNGVSGLPAPPVQAPGQAQVSGGVGSLPSTPIAFNPNDPTNSTGSGAQAGSAAPAPPPAAPAFDPTAQVGHNGTVNGMTREQYRDAWQSSGITNNAGLDAWLAQHGGKRIGNGGQVMTPFGEQIDMGTAFSTGHGTAAWGGMDGGGSAPAGAGGSTGAAGGGVPLGSIGGGGVGGGGNGSAQVGQSGHLQGFTPTAFNAPAPFQAPSLADAQTNPGYEFAQQEAQRALQQSAAAHGGALGANTMTALSDRANQAATQNYQQVYNNALQSYNTNFGNQLQAWQGNINADQGYGALANTAQANANQFGLGMANVGLGYHSADQSYDLGLRNNALGYTQAGNAFTLGMGQLGLGYANYGLNAQGQQFNQAYSMANMGLTAAQIQAGAGGMYSQNAGGYLTQQGNANAAAQAANGQAYANAFNGMTGAGMYYLTHQNQNGGG